MFKRFTTQELIEYTRQFKFTRRVTQFHVHHCYKPDYSGFTGANHEALQQGMKNYHMNTNGWSDIGQNLTLFPDGIWLLGRDFNKDPASILGWNTGALAVEMVGNFDIGQDTMTEKQSDSIHAFTEFIVEEMGLEVKFHRESPTTQKTCPGTSLDKAKFMQESINYTEEKESELKMAEIKEATRHFKDLVDAKGNIHWSTQYVNLLADKRIISGFDDANGDRVFAPDRPITRGEMATLLVKMYESLQEDMKKGVK